MRATGKEPRKEGKETIEEGNGEGARENGMYG